MAFLAGASAQTEPPGVTGRLAKHAVLFQMYDTKRRAEDVKPNAQGIVDLSPQIIKDYGARITQITPDEELQEQAQRSDAVVIGKMVRRYSALTQGHSFLYSDWVVNVSTVFKGTSLVPFRVGDDIAVTRTGGDLVLNGRHLVARDMTFPDFGVGREYVLYLFAHADSASFIAFAEGSIDIAGPKPVPLFDPNDPTTLRGFCNSVSTAQFVSAVERTSK